MDIWSSLKLHQAPAIQLVPEKGTVAPAAPVTGQLWVDTSVTPNLVRTWDGTGWVSLQQYAGTTAGTYAAGNDTRLFDQRVPTDGSVTGGPAGVGVKIAAGTITDVNVATANKDGVVGLASLRTIGTGAQQAMAGSTTLSSLAGPTADIALGGFKFTGGGAPVSANDYVRLTDLNAAQAGIDNKPSARLLLAANDTLNGLAARDGITPVVGDRVLAVAQTTASQNGIYVAAAGAWTRANDTITPQAFWLVEEGATYASTQWKVSNAGAIVVGTTALVINQFGAAGLTYAGGTGISIVGSTIAISGTYTGQASITTVGTITAGVWTGTAIAIANGGTSATTAAQARTNLGATTKVVGTLTGTGAATTFAFPHNLATITHLTQVSDATNQIVLVDTVLGLNSDSITFAVAPANAVVFNLLALG